MHSSRRNSILLRTFLLLFTLALLSSCGGKTEVKPEAEFDPEKSMARANELIEKKDYEEARKILLEVKNRDFTKKFSPLAQLRIADSYAKEEEYDLAVEEYRRFLEFYPDHKNAPYAQYQIGMTYFSQIESPERGHGAAAKALEEFEKLKRLFPRNPYKEIIEVRIEKCRETIADYGFLVGEYYFKKGSYNAALGRFQELISKFPDYKKMPTVLFHIGVSYKNTGDKEKAAQYFNLLIEKHPNDRLVKDAQKELAALSK